MNLPRMDSIWRAKTEAVWTVGSPDWLGIELDGGLSKVKTTSMRKADKCAARGVVDVTDLVVCDLRGGRLHASLF